MHRTSITRSAASLAALCLLAAPASAHWPHDPSVNVPVVQAAGTQSIESMIPDGNGGAYVSWYDNRVVANPQVYIQHLDPSGVGTWAANGIPVASVTGTEFGSQLLLDGSGGVIAVWTDLRNGTSYQLFAQRFNAAGVAKWTANGVAVAPGSGNQFSPQMVADAAGGYVLVWQDNRNALTTALDIYAQRLNASGGLLWGPNGTAVCTAPAAQNNPALISDEGGRLDIVWADDRNFATTGYDIYAQLLTTAGAPYLIANGIPVCAASNAQQSPLIVNDGNSGSVICWQDYRSGTNFDIYTQRLDSFGNTAWVLNGIAVTSDATSQTNVRMAPDGLGGAFIGWSDNRNDPVNTDCFVQDVSYSGAMTWGSTGLALCTATGYQALSTLFADDRGGCIAAWQDGRTSPGRIYAQRAFAGSTRWTFNGVDLTDSPLGSNTALAVTDGNGGAIVAFNDNHFLGASQDIYVQGVDAFGYLGAEPSIASVRDVAGDQGGQVKLSWNASPLDTDPATSSVLFDYLIYRSVPAATAQLRVRQGARAVPAAQFDGRDTGALVTTNAANGTIYWENIAHESARHLPGYSHVVPTTGDSVAAGAPKTLFMVMAENSSGSLYWTSDPDSGYSVDNLAPATPAPFTGNYVSGNALLTWGANAEADFAGYRLYRGTSLSFTPGPGNLVTQKSDAGYLDAAGQPYVYKLTAIDVHGNESAPATLVPSGALAVGDAAPRELFLASPAPDPLRAGARAMLRFGLPADARITLALYDVGGRRVRELATGPRAAGEHSVALEASDARGRALASGLYFVRLESGGRTLVRRVTVLE